MYTPMSETSAHWQFNQNEYIYVFVFKKKKSKSNKNKLQLISEELRPNLSPCRGRSAGKVERRRRVHPGVVRARPGRTAAAKRRGEERRGEPWLLSPPLFPDQCVVVDSEPRSRGVEEGAEGVGCQITERGCTQLSLLDLRRRKVQTEAPRSQPSPLLTRTHTRAQGRWGGGDTNALPAVQISNSPSAVGSVELSSDRSL